MAALKTVHSPLITFGAVRKREVLRKCRVKTLPVPLTSDDLYL
jgi:hypothetical protein